MHEVMQWVATLNATNHTAFAFLTILATTIVGGSVAFLIELLFTLLGIRNTKIHQKL